MNKLLPTVCAALSVAGFTWGFLAPQVPSDHPSPTPQLCFEDEACWDCWTMGNMICGR